MIMTEEEMDEQLELMQSIHEEEKQAIKKQAKNARGMLHCPFCGGEAHLYTDEESGYYMIGCGNCCAVEPMTEWCESKENAILQWNTRKQFERIVERLGEIRNIFEEDRHVEEYCREKRESCRDTNCFACILNQAIEIVKEEGGIDDNT